MAYTHGTEWTEEKIIEKINEVISKLKIKRFPTRKEIREYYHNDSLTNKISKSGGTRYWANKLNLDTKDCDSKTGELYENYCLSYLINMGYEGELMKVRYPYDILINNNVKIDIKSGYKFSNYDNSPYYSFNLEKKHPTCDIFVIYCLNNDGTIYKTYVIPSKFLFGKTQLALGINSSKYDKFIDAWDYVEKFNEFYNTL